jgi:hypothetical protein
MWNLLVDKTANAGCLNDIAAADHALQPLYQRAQETHLANRVKGPWSGDLIQILRDCYEPLDVSSAALQQFKVVQEQPRSNGVPNVSLTSRRWTDDEIQLANSRLKWLEETIADVRPMSVDEQEEQPGHSNAVNAHATGQEVDVHDPNAVNAPANEQEEPQNSNAVGAPANENKKQPSQRHRPVNAPEANAEARMAFLDRRSKFLRARQGENQRRWCELYDLADRVQKKGGPFEFPNGDDDDAQEEFAVRINKALEEAIGWAWQSRIDGASENGDVNGNGVNWKRTLQLARAEAMRRAREGEAEVWSPPPEPPPPVTVIDAARRFGFGGGDVGIGGEWAYLCTLGRGGQGEAVLWASVRFDDHGNAIDVSTSVPPFIKSPWVRFHRSRWKRSPTVSTALGGQRQLFREDLEERSSMGQQLLHRTRAGTQRNSYAPSGVLRKHCSYGSPVSRLQTHREVFHGTHLHVILPPQRSSEPSR